MAGTQNAHLLFSYKLLIDVLYVIFSLKLESGLPIFYGLSLCTAPCRILVQGKENSSQRITEKQRPTRFVLDLFLFSGICRNIYIRNFCKYCQE